MKFLNLTPHPIKIFEGTNSFTYPVNGPAVRLVVEQTYLGQIDGISIVRSTTGAPIGLPEQQEGVILIVSAMVAEHPSLASRTDLAYPGEAVRDSDGKIIGAKGLCANPGLASYILSKSITIIVKDNHNQLQS
jgi:hypothetical protein